jgi:hypothetical protein
MVLGIIPQIMYCSLYKTISPPSRADCLLSSDQRLRDSVCGRVERGTGLGMSGAGTTQRSSVAISRELNAKCWSFCAV